MIGALILLAALPATNYVVALDNELVRVVRVNEAVATHDRSKLPTIYVYLGDSGPVRLLGAFRVSPGGTELGDTPSHFLRVELKRMPLGDQAFAHRQDRPADTSRPGKNVEFESQQVSVERIIGADSIEAGSPSLLVALAPIELKVTRKPRSFSTKMACGDLYWLDATESATLTGHALRVVFRK